LKAPIIIDAVNQVIGYWITNTGIKMVAAFNKAILIRRAKRPNVIQMSGKKRIRKIGFISKLRSERIRARTMSCSNVPLKEKLLNK
jgi:hypothetical protein